VDLVFTGIILVGIALSRHDPSRARAALAVLCAYIGVAALVQSGARNLVRDAALRGGVKVVSTQALPTLPYIDLPSVESLISPSEAIASHRSQAAGTDGGWLSRKVGIPFPAGPVAWNGFVDDGRNWLRAEIDPFTGRVAWEQRVLHGQEVPEVRALRGQQDVETYLWFARFPTAEVSTAGGRIEVTFQDLRFSGWRDRRPFVLKVIDVPGGQPTARWGE
jgi:hypothetical protein